MTNQADRELLPCPWCGESPRNMPSASDGRVYWIECRNRKCGINPSHHWVGSNAAVAKVKAVTAWNTRATPTEPTP